MILAMRAFFHLDDAAINGIEDALLGHGGEGALELAATQDGALAQEELV